MRNEVKELQEAKKIAEEAASQVQKHPLHVAEAQASHAGLLSPELSILRSALSTTKSEWEGIQGNRAGTIYYGPMSSSYFVNRITRYLYQTLDQSSVEAPFQACGTEINHSTPSRQPKQSNTNSLNENDNIDGTEEAENFTRFQEEYFLDFFWQSFHCVYPIISEPCFRKYYDSLWTHHDSEEWEIRKPSPLVDVLLALCVQYGSSFLNDDDEVGYQAKNPCTAGHPFYRRCQKLLSNKLENLSIMVLQSHVYSIIYLYNLSLLNTAYIHLGVAIQIAHTLRLHLRPFETTPQVEQELQRRIWWTLYCLDSKLSITLGRPPLINTSDISCGFPCDKQSPALLLGTTLMSDHDDISWLSFHNISVELASTVRHVQGAFCKKCSQILNDHGLRDIHDDARITEVLAEFLGNELGAIRDWVRNVPNSLRCSRKGDAQPFSTSLAALNLDSSSPLWLQRQRLLLELFYHHLQISTLRPFLHFPPVASSITPLADGHSIACLNHAMTTTSILNRVFSETDILWGWSPIFQYQWDAVLCTLGFIFANPVHSSIPSARDSLQIAIGTLEILGEHSTAAANAAQVAREVDFRADFLIRKYRNDSFLHVQRSLE